MKKEYQDLQIDIIYFDGENIITDSATSDVDDEGTGTIPGGWTVFGS